ncbi:MAG TPA: glutaredoxin family protein [Verrucomicrobiales bacterium]|nr:glutaredoxin family protein [Verrucomicrobiales bacterium]
MNLPVLYVKTGCPWCVAAVDYLDEHGITYQSVNVAGNPAAMQELVEMSGQTKAPTMSFRGDFLADFGVDELEPFLKKHALM